MQEMCFSLQGPFRTIFESISVLVSPGGRLSLDEETIGGNNELL